MAIQLPIFELPLVLLPGERVPLHIFEERYQRMIAASLDSGEPFGVVLHDAEGARSVGCTADVSEVLNRFDDGRMDIIVTGGTRFRVLDRFDDPEDPSAEVEVEAEDQPEPDADIDDSAATARAAFLDLAERATGERPSEEEIAEDTAYALAARIELPVETKQELLQLRDEGDRMRLLAEVLTVLQDAVERTEEVAERAQSNGKVRIGP
jgi:Lon protease-like protein